jgi:acetyl esterase/lipase
MTGILFTMQFLLASCATDDTISDPSPFVPTVQRQATYEVEKVKDVVYGYGYGHNNELDSTVETALMLDIYRPMDITSPRPVYMFMHGGGFIGGSKSNENIEAMGEYFASRGWIFLSIDYRTTAHIGQDLSKLAPQEWINAALQNQEINRSAQFVAMYMAQRDAKAAMRWIMANAEQFSIDENYITVGGSSAGAITALALGVSNSDDFSKELSADEDPTLSTTNLNESYRVNSIISYWGSSIKLDLFEQIYGEQRFDSNDPKLFMAHGTMDDTPYTDFSNSLDLLSIYATLGIYAELLHLEGYGHGAWNAYVNNKSLSDHSFDFLVQQQGLNVQ